MDLLIYSPIALFNFAFIPPGLYQTIFVNTAYVLIVEPIGSLIINNGMQVADLWRSAVNALLAWNHIIEFTSTEIIE